MTLPVIIYVISLFLRWQDYESPLANQLSSFGNQTNVGSFGVAILIYLARLMQLAWLPTLSRRVRRQVIVLSGGLLVALPYIAIVVTRALVPSLELRHFQASLMPVVFLHQRSDATSRPRKRRSGVVPSTSQRSGAEGT